MNEDKTKIVLCKSDLSYPGEDSTNVSFDFLGFTFSPRSAVDPRTNITFVGYLLAISIKSIRKINDRIREWTSRRFTRANVDEIAAMVNPSVQGWLNFMVSFIRLYLEEFCAMSIIFFIVGRRGSLNL